jgi:hypothetical protein
MSDTKFFNAVRLGPPGTSGRSNRLVQVFVAPDAVTIFDLEAGERMDSLRERYRLIAVSGVLGSLVPLSLTQSRDSSGLDHSLMVGAAVAATAWVASMVGASADAARNARLEARARQLNRTSVAEALLTRPNPMRLVRKDVRNIEMKKELVVTLWKEDSTLRFQFLNEQRDSAAALEKLNVVLMGAPPAPAPQPAPQPLSVQASPDAAGALTTVAPPQRQEEETRPCPHCHKTISSLATRCVHCMEKC